MMSAVPRIPATSGLSAGGVYYEVHGDGVPLFLGFPVLASYAQVFGSVVAHVKQGFLDRLTDRYRVLLVDYPSIGGSATIPPAELTLDRACTDLLAVADAAGFERFAWWGGTFGAVAGLALAARSDRVTALVCAGWPPLGAPYAEMARGALAQLADPPMHARVMLREPAQYAQWPSFYASVAAADAAGQLARIRCPRSVIYGADAESSVGDVPLPLAATIRARRAELERAGWRLDEIAGADATLILDPARLVPAARAFLDSVLPYSSISRGYSS